LGLNTALFLLCAALQEPAALSPATARQVERGIAGILGLEESGSPGEWAYEGALRVEGVLPIGFRVGGTGYVVMALAKLPGLADDEPRQKALARGVDFLAAELAREGMSAEIYPGVDLRFWGLVEGLNGLLAARRAGERGAHSGADLDRLLGDLLARLAALEIPREGGWNYNRPSGRRLPAPPCSYATAEVLQAFFEARSQGFAVDAALVERGLAVLLSQRLPTGAFLYDGTSAQGGHATLPGAVGRMLVCESTLFCAERSDVLHVRAALDAFLAHWDILDERRGRTGLHEGPHGVAPHNFFYAHAHAARAIELLPEIDRAEYRARLAEKLESVRDAESGLWNDRVYKRSAAYGTAAALLALSGPVLAPDARWSAPAEGE
jgi:hypothetical protein